MVLDRFNQAAEERVDHIFWRLLILIAAAGGIGLVMLIVYGVLVSGRFKRTSD
jgi:hypothetical protein